MSHCVKCSAQCLVHVSAVYVCAMTIGCLSGLHTGWCWASSPRLSLDLLLHVSFLQPLRPVMLFLLGTSEQFSRGSTSWECPRPGSIYTTVASLELGQFLPLSELRFNPVNLVYPAQDLECKQATLP